MDPEYFRTVLVARVRRGHLSFDQAAREMSRGLGMPIEGTPIGEALTMIRAQQERTQMLDVPPVIRGSSYHRSLQTEARLRQWYTGV